MHRQDEIVASFPNWFLVLVSSAIIIGALWIGRDFLTPLAITGLVFILSSAMVDWICKLSLAGISPPRWFGNLLAASIVIAALFFLGAVLSEAGKEIADSGANLRGRLLLLADRLEGFIGPDLADRAESAIAGLNFGGWLAAFVGQLAGGVSSLVLVALYLIFLISEHMAWVEKLPLLASNPSQAKRNRKVLERIASGVKQYMLVNAITSALSATGAYIIFRWIGLDFAAFLAVIVFIVGFIPNIGAFIGIVLPSLVALLQFDTLTPFLIVLVGYGLFDQLVSNILQPAMQGKSLNVSTFMVMVSLTFWGSIWGGIGVFLAVPMMVVIMVICTEIPTMRWLAILLSGDGALEYSDVEACS